MNKKLKYSLIAGFSVLAIAGTALTYSAFAASGSVTASPTPSETVAESTATTTPSDTPDASPTPSTPAPTATPKITPTPQAPKYAPVPDVPVADGATVVETTHIYAYENGQHGFKLIQLRYSDGSRKFTLPDGTPFNYYVIVETGTW